MNTIKCKYNWDDGTVELLFSDGTTVALLCKGIEADLNIGIKVQGKLNALKVEKPSEYAVMALNGTLQAYCDTIDRSDSTSQNTLYDQYRRRYPDMCDEQTSRYEALSVNVRCTENEVESMAKVIETIENATLVSVEQLDDRNTYEWDWRYKFVGCKGTLYIGESQQKSPGKRFVTLTDNKDFRLTTGYGKIEQAEKHITITTKSSRYIFTT